MTDSRLPSVICALPFVSSPISTYLSYVVDMDKCAPPAEYATNFKIYSKE